MAKPRVSVIIPAYNADRFLGATLESVFGQKYADYEIIVIDDGSSDNTMHIARSYRGVRYYCQANRGPAAARNVGLRAAQGEYLAFLDADDLWQPTMLAKCVAILDARPEVGTVHTDWSWIDADGTRVGMRGEWQPWRGDIFERLLVTIPFNTSCLLTRRHFYDVTGGYDETPELNDDWLNWLRMAKVGCWFEPLEEELVLRRLHIGSLSRAQRRRVIEWRRRSLEQIGQEFSVPAGIMSQAKASVDWLSGLDWLEQGEREEALRDLVQVATNYAGQYLKCSTYYQLAEAIEVSFGGDHAYSSAVEETRVIVGEVLKSARSDIELQATSNRQIAGLADFCLARMTYGDERYSAGIGRRLLYQSLLAWPGFGLDKSNWPWTMRIVAGRQAISWLGRILGIQAADPRGSSR